MSLALKIPDPAVYHDVDVDHEVVVDHELEVDPDAADNYAGLNGDGAPSPEAGRPPLRFSANEERLRNQFVGAFNDARQPGFELYIAVRDVTDDLKRAGALPETVVKRIKYIAAIPIAFHYRVGYKGNRERLRDTMSRAISLSIETYFNERKTTTTEDYRPAAFGLDG
jgi:hypothetical protein